MYYKIKGNEGKRAFDLYPLALGFAVGIALSFVALAVSIHFI